jgi:hypothetical protein
MNKAALRRTFFSPNLLAGHGSGVKRASKTDLLARVNGKYWPNIYNN